MTFVVKMNGTLFRLSNEQQKSQLSTEELKGERN